MEVKRIRSKVVMLPTEKESNLFIDSLGSLNIDSVLRSKTEYKEYSVIPQHLYFTIDEKIKEGDWCIHLPSKQVIKYPEGGFPETHSKKIVASTDTSLGLPQPTQAFIKKYCELGGIEEVDLEYEEYRAMLGVDIDDNTKINYSEPWYELKVDSHNTITIHAIKNSWSREEVIYLLKKVMVATNIEDNMTFEKLDYWIKENL